MKFFTKKNEFVFPEERKNNLRKCNCGYFLSPANHYLANSCHIIFGCEKLYCDYYFEKLPIRHLSLLNEEDL